MAAGTNSSARIKDTGLALMVAWTVGCSSQPVTPPGPTATVPRSVSIAISVRDALSHPIRGAVVNVTTPPGSTVGGQGTTDDRGHLVLTVDPPPAGVFEIQVSAEGFVTAVQRREELGIPGVCPSAASCSLDAWVVLEAASPVDLSGPYRVGFRVDPSCSGLPEATRSRAYRASIEAVSPLQRDRFRVTLSGAAFASGQDHFEAAAMRDRMAFDVRPGLFPNDEWMSVVEEVALDTYLAFNGRAEAGVPDGRGTIEAPFTGSIVYCPATPAMPFYTCPVDAIRCTAGVLSLTRE